MYQALDAGYMFPALGTGYKFLALGTGYMSPALGTGYMFPAIFTDYMFSHAWRQLLMPLRLIFFIPAYILIGWSNDFLFGFASLEWKLT